MSAAAPPAPAPRRRIAGRQRFSKRQRIVVGVINLTIFFVLWEVYASVSGIERIFLPKISLIWTELQEMHSEGLLVDNILISLRVYFVGLTLSILIGVPLGLLVGGIKVLDRILLPYLWVIYTMPLIILMPLILLWVGINDTARVVLIIVSAVPAIVVIVMEGVKTVDPSLLRAARSFGAQRAVLFTKVIFPSTLPFIGTGVKMGVSRGLIGLFVGELFTSADGIGYIIELSSKVFNTARVFGMLLIFVLFSVAVVGLAQYVERRLSAWRTSVSV
jgi:ABC-type nitrate/sulfonate/bicarbonate transport system permease component